VENWQLYNFSVSFPEFVDDAFISMGFLSFQEFHDIVLLKVLLKLQVYLKGGRGYMAFNDTYPLYILKPPSKVAGRVSVWKNMVVDTKLLLLCYNHILFQVVVIFAVHLV
jgi:hypothetical protein